MTGSSSENQKTVSHVLTFGMEDSYASLKSVSKMNMILEPGVSFEKHLQMEKVIPARTSSVDFIANGYLAAASASRTNR